MTTRQRDSRPKQPADRSKATTVQRLALGAGAAAALALLANSGKLARWVRREDLRGQVVVITGGSRGLGLALAEEFARHGVRLAICARDEQELAAAARMLAEAGAEVCAEPADLARRDEAERLIQRVTERFGRVDVLVNVAGVIIVGPLLDQALDDFEQVMADNFWTAVNATFAVLPHMLARHHGRIVNITSLGGKVSVPHLLPYSASKFGFYGFSSGLHTELAKEGIRVTTVVPGLMRTGSYLNTVVKGQHAKEFALFSVVGSLPLITMSARRAARQIVAATRRGDPELTVTVAADLLCKLQDLAPGTSATVLGLINRLLPGSAGPEGKRRRIGAECQSAITRSFLTGLNQRAADRLNERIAAAHPQRQLRELAREPTTGPARGNSAPAPV